MAKDKNGNIAVTYGAVMWFGIANDFANKNFTNSTAKLP
jgi:hypothetical protein